MDYIFEKGKFTEDELEHAIIELFEKQEYTYVPGESIHRQYEDILLLDDLRSFLSARYAQNRLSEVEMQKIINKLVMIQATQLYLGNREAFWLVNEGFDLVRDDISQVALHVDYIDFDHPENNIFKVVNQYSVQGERLRRPDLLVFINGIPIAICEFKTAIEEDTTIHDAWEQITIRYTRDIPKLMKYCFLSVISDGANTRLGSIFTPYKFYYSWNKANDTDKVSNGISSLLTMIEGAFAKDRVLQILRDFIFYPDDSKKDEAIVCRYPQFFGAHKMLDSVREHMRPEGDGKGGTYFGATGCGKTYTMLFLSRLIALRDILLNDILKNRQSKVRSEFVALMQPGEEDKIRQLFSKKEVQPDDDITVSIDQTESLYEAITFNGLEFPQVDDNGEFDGKELLPFLERLCGIFKWERYESDTLGHVGKDSQKHGKLSWYSVILSQWVRGAGLNQIMFQAIDQKRKHPTNAMFDRTTRKYYDYTDTLRDRNDVISDVLNVIDKIILFKFSNYFLKVAKAYKEIRGQDPKDNWYEFVEYGSTNKRAIAIQKHGFSRESAMYILRQGQKYIAADEPELRLHRSILECPNKGVRNDADMIQYNIPDLFVD